MPRCLLTWLTLHLLTFLTFTPFYTVRLPHPVDRPFIPGVQESTSRIGKIRVVLQILVVLFLHMFSDVSHNPSECRITPSLPLTDAFSTIHLRPESPIISHGIYTVIPSPYSPIISNRLNPSKGLLQRLRDPPSPHSRTFV